MMPGHFDDEIFVAGAALVVSAIGEYFRPRPPRCNGFSPSLQPQISSRQERPTISLTQAT